MNRFEEKFRRISEDIRLTDAERSRVWKAIIAHQKAHPLGSVPSPFSPARTGTEHLSLQKNLFRTPSPFFLRVPALAGLACLLLFGSVSYAAEGSIPGDLFYPVKVSINEEVHGALLLSEESKASWDIARAERRLEEAETLATEGRITPEIEERLSADFKSHTQRAATRIALLTERQSDAAPVIATDLEMSLRAHEGVLALVTGRGASDEGPLTIAVRVEADSAASHAGSSASATISTEVQVRSMSLKAEPTASSASNFPEATALKMKERALEEEKKARTALNRATLSETARLEAESRLETAHTSIVRGDALFASKGEGHGKESFSAYQEAFISLTRLSVLLRSNLFSRTDDGERSGKEEKEKEKKPASSAGSMNQFEDKAILHTYRNGTHRFYGAFVLPTPCNLLSTDARRKGDTVTLSFTVASTDSICIQKVERSTFDVSITGPQDATISVLVNGTAVSDAHIVEKGTSSSTNATSTSSGSSSSVKIQQIISL